MKGKSTAKNQRRAAGLPIRASLEPRLDPAGNPASDIFRAVKENEINLAQAKKQNDKDQDSQKIDSSNFRRETEVSNIRDQRSADSISSNEINTAQKAKSENKYDYPEAEIVPGNTLVSFGNGQMRVVSLQPTKTRKLQKQPRKLLKVVTQSKEVDKIPILFERTKAEEIYDLLFQLTLGADEPCDSVRVRRSDLMASTNIKTRITLDLNLKRLEENGLIKIESRPGEQEGNIYTVYPIPNQD